MAELDKNVLTDEQKMEKEIIDKIHSALKITYEKFGGRIDKYDLEDAIKAIYREYKLIPQYDTLEDYIKEHADGGYCKFVFEIDDRQMECCEIGEFAYYYNFNILKNYVVVDDKEENNIHNLTVKHKGEFE